MQAYDIQTANKPLLEEGLTTTVKTYPGDTCCTIWDSNDASEDFCFSLGEDTKVILLDPIGWGSGRVESFWCGRYVN